MIDIDAKYNNLEAGFLRLKQILGDPKAQPPIPAIIPVGKSTWWKWVQEGKAPSPIKLGPRITVWRAEEIHSFIKQFTLPDSRLRPTYKTPYAAIPPRL
jgi:prophage regulatory protein